MSGVLPFSLTELNSRLALLHPGDSFDSLSIPCMKSYPSFKNFISTLQFFLSRAPDGSDKAQTSLLFKHVSRLFPDEPKNEKTCFLEFIRKIRQFTPSQESGASGPSKPDDLLSFNIFNQGISSSPITLTIPKDQLFPEPDVAEMNAKVMQPLEARLAFALEKMPNISTTAEKLQLILSFLNLEDRLMQLGHEKSQLILLSQNNLRFCKEGSSGTYQFCNDRFYLAFDFKLEDVEKNDLASLFKILSLTIKFKELSNLKMLNHQTVKKFKQLDLSLRSLSSKVSKELQGHLRKVKAYRDHVITFMFSTSYPLPWDSFLPTLFKTPLSQLCKEYDTAYFMIAPYGRAVYSILIEQTLVRKSEQASTVIRSILEEDPLPYRQREEIYKAYLAQRDAQAAFYNFVHEKLISETSSTHLRKYRKDLYAIEGDIAPILPPNLPQLTPPLDLMTKIENYCQTFETSEEFRAPDTVEAKKTALVKKHKNKEARRIAAFRATLEEESRCLSKDEPSSAEHDSSPSPKTAELNSLDTAPFSRGEERRTLITDFPFSYANRILRWFSIDLKAPLSADIFPEYQEEGCDQKMMVLYHGFSPLVDRFFNVGLTENWQNSTTGHEDTQYIIPAEIEISHERIRGAIVYCIGRDNVCYHRFFHKMDDKSLLQKFGLKTFEKSDFPELSKDESLTLQTVDQMKDSTEDSVIEDPDHDIIIIHDSSLNIQITLFTLEK